MVERQRVSVGVRECSVIEDDPGVFVRLDLFRQLSEKLGFVIGVVRSRRAMETKVSQRNVTSGNGCFGGCLGRIGCHTGDCVLPEEYIGFFGKPCGVAWLKAVSPL